MYKRDRRDALTWTDGKLERAQDPVSFRWYENRLRESKLEETRGGATHRVFDFQRFRYWLIGDTLYRREVVPLVMGTSTPGATPVAQGAGIL
jgi:hypothetical protein